MQANRRDDHCGRVLYEYNEYIWSEDIKVDRRPLCGRTHKEARKEACKYKEAHRGEN